MLHLIGRAILVDVFLGPRVVKFWNGKTMFSSRYFSLFLVFFASTLVAEGFLASAAQAVAFQEANGGEEKKKVKPEAVERHELLLKVKFDRTPAGILKAWSSDKIKSKKVKKDDEDNKDKPAAASITNAFKDFVFLTLDETSSFKKDQLLTVVDSKGDIIGEIKLLTVEGKEVSAKVQPKPSAENQKKSKTENPTEQKSIDEATTEEKAIQKPLEVSASKLSPATGKALRMAMIKLTGAQPTKASAVYIETDDETGNETDEKSGRETNDEKTDDNASSTAETTPAEHVVPSLSVEVGDRIALSILSAKDKAKHQTERLKKEIAAFSKDVTLGNWEKVKAYFEKIEDKKKADQVYSYLLSELVVAMPHLEKQGAQKRSQAESRGEEPPHSVFTPLDLIALSDASPTPISIIKKKDRATINAGNTPDGNDDSDDADTTDKKEANITKAKADEGENEKAPSPIDAKKIKKDNEKEDEDGDTTSAAQLAQLGTLLRISMEAGYDMEPFYNQLTSGTTHFGGDDLGKQLTAAHWLMSCNLHDRAEAFLPEVDDVNFHDNIYSLRSWNRIANARYSQKRKIKWLKTVWNINQNIFKSENAEQSDIDSSLARLIELTPQLDKSIGQKWSRRTATGSFGNAFGCQNWYRQ